MRRVAVKIAYLGKDFCGSQYQPGLRTAMGDVLSDITKISGDKDIDRLNFKVSSRTDGGVNALENVIVFNTMIDDDEELLRALNSVSKSIFYKSIATVDDSFNPRFANERVYRYILPSEGVDVAKAGECAALFVGEHDFKRFCKLYDRDTVMTIDSIALEEDDGYIIFTFRAQYFLWNMIRKIVAAIASVGRGHHSMDEVIRALEGEDINFGLARPDALTLTEINYDYVTFNDPANKHYMPRVKEEQFTDMLRKDFFRAL